MTSLPPNLPGESPSDPLSRVPGRGAGNVPFGADTACAPWNQPDAAPRPRCAYCAKEAERAYPDQSDADMALPYTDAEQNDFCSRACAVEFSLTVRARREASAAGREACELRKELSRVYQAASLLADLDDEVLRLIASSDDSQGVLELPQDAALSAERRRFLDLAGLRAVAGELCGLLGGEDGDPGWLCGDGESQKSEEWLEPLVGFRTRRFRHEVWPRARDLSRTQIAALYSYYQIHCSGFYANLSRRNDGRRNDEAAGPIARSA